MTLYFLCCSILIVRMLKLLWILCTMIHILSCLWYGFACPFGNCIVGSWVIPEANGKNTLLSMFSCTVSWCCINIVHTHTHICTHTCACECMHTYNVHVCIVVQWPRFPIPLIPWLQDMQLLKNIPVTWVHSNSEESDSDLD